MYSNVYILYICNRGLLCVVCLSATNDVTIGAAEGGDYEDVSWRRRARDQLWRCVVRNTFKNMFYTGVT